MITLGIETSCDETAVCLLETRTNTSGILEYRVLENLIHSQADMHAKYGGVFPMMAKREHEKNLPILIEEILGEKSSSTSASASAKIKIDQIAVTKGPGLEPTLRVGIEYAQKLAEELNVPIVGVNHMEGHILGSLLSSSEASLSFVELKTLPLPALALLISGGHTELVLIKKIGENGTNKKSEYEVVGRTKDDAVGEAFDKVARLLGLPYPGGPPVSALAEQARNENATKKNSVTQEQPPLHLPRPMIHSADLDFSFSGLKTAVLYEIRKTDENASMKPPKVGTEAEPEKVIDNNLTDSQKKEIAREFEDAVTEVIVKKTAKAIEKYGAQSLIAGGGVIANKHICEALEKLAGENSIPLFLPPTGVSGDNALMIALAGAMSGVNTTGEDSGTIKADGNLSL
jgi:N6-L-threonylcarbamoyladenine synthase